MTAEPAEHYGPLTRAALQRSNALHTDCFVYFVADVDQKRVKIGKAKDVGRRLKTLQTSHSSELVLLGTLAGDAALERELHEAFAGDRIRGEWFQMSGRLAELISDAYRAGTNREMGDTASPVKDPAPPADQQLRKLRRIPAATVSEFAELMGIGEQAARRYIHDLMNEGVL